jgi:hypothetical protein
MAAQEPAGAAPRPRSPGSTMSSSGAFCLRTGRSAAGSSAGHLKVSALVNAQVHLSRHQPRARRPEKGCESKPDEVTWLTPTTGPRSQGKPYLTIYSADMTLRESPPGAELRVAGFTYASRAASSSGPRLRHIAGGLRPPHPAAGRRPVRHLQTLCPPGQRQGQAPSSAGPHLHAVGTRPLPVQHLKLR